MVPFLLNFIPTLGLNTKEIPLETQDELCWYYYLKIYTPRKCSATVILALFKEKRNKTGFPFEYTFPFSLANVNKLTCYKQIYLYFGGRQFSLSLQRTALMSTGEELYRLLLGWYHPWCNLSYIWKNIYTVY